MTGHSETHMHSFSLPGKVLRIEKVHRRTSNRSCNFSNIDIIQNYKIPLNHTFSFIDLLLGVMHIKTLQT